MGRKHSRTTLLSLCRSEHFTTKQMTLLKPEICKCCCLKSTRWCFSGWNKILCLAAASLQRKFNPVENESNCCCAAIITKTVSPTIWHRYIEKISRATNFWLAIWMRNEKILSENELDLLTVHPPPSSLTGQTNLKWCQFSVAAFIDRYGYVWQTGNEYSSSPPPPFFLHGFSHFPYRDRKLAVPARVT